MECRVLMLLTDSGTLLTAHNEEGKCWLLGFSHPAFIRSLELNHMHVSLCCFPHCLVCVCLFVHYSYLIMANDLPQDEPSFLLSPSLQCLTSELFAASPSLLFRWA